LCPDQKKNKDNPLLRYKPKISGVSNYFNNNFNSQPIVDNFQKQSSLGYREKESAQNKNAKGNSNLNLNVNLFSSNQVLKSNSLNKEYNSEKKNSFSNNIANTDRSLNNEISQIMNENNSFHSLNVSHNVNKDINLNSYSKEDLQESILLSKLDDKNLIKVIDDLNDYNIYLTNNNNYGPTEGNFNHNLSNGPKFKFMIISAKDTIPNLVDCDKKISICDADLTEGLKFYKCLNFNSDLKNKLNLENYKIVEDNSTNLKFLRLEPIVRSL
jgi:hypothetical protein